MAAAGEIDLGIFSSPGELKAAADRVNSEIRAMDNAIDGNDDLSQALWDSWQDFLSRWKAFYNGTFDTPVWSWLTSRTGSLSDQLEAWTNDAKNYAQQFQAEGVEIPGGVLTAAEPFHLSDLTKPLAEGFGQTFGVVLVLVIVGALIYFKGLK